MLGDIAPYRLSHLVRRTTAMRKDRMGQRMRHQAPHPPSMTNLPGQFETSLTKHCGHTDDHKPEETACSKRQPPRSHRHYQGRFLDRKECQQQQRAEGHTGAWKCVVLRCSISELLHRMNLVDFQLWNLDPVDASNGPFPIAFGRRLGDPALNGGAASANRALDERGQFHG